MYLRTRTKNETSRNDPQIFAENNTAKRRRKPKSFFNPIFTYCKSCIQVRW